MSATYPAVLQFRGLTTEHAEDLIAAARALNLSTFILDRLGGDLDVQVTSPQDAFDLGAEHGRRRQERQR